MFPIAPIQNESNHCRCDAVLFSQPALLSPFTRVCGPDGPDIFLSQLRSSVVLTAQISASSLRSPVCVVLRPSSSPEMAGVAALWVVAAMEHKRLRGWQWSISNHVSKSVSENGRSTIPAAPNVQRAIAKVVAGASPVPASVGIIRYIHSAPERLNLSWGNINSHVSLLTDVPRRRVFSAPLRLSVLSPQLYQMVTR